jgi:hypothetical protein
LELYQQALNHTVHLDHQHHLAYCTNIHPAESWEETWNALKQHTLKVRDQLTSDHRSPTSAFAIGLRLSARAAAELLAADHLPRFRDWLAAEDCYVFTINGFPYGAFHGTRVKENVYRPDWSTPDRLAYTKDRFTIIATLAPADSGGSVSTLPGSFKEFHADESAIFANLEACAHHIDSLARQSGKDLHLGLEPEPLGHFENTAETLAFFGRFLAATADPDLVRRRIGINYDTCHFAVEFEDCTASLDLFRKAGLRISKVHLSSALALDSTDPAAREALRAFDEPTYLHQLIRDDDGTIVRYRDLPEALPDLEPRLLDAPGAREARVHFHIPLYSEPAPPLRSTKSHLLDLLAYRRVHPDFCSHYEIETYTWGVLPGDLQKPIVDQIAEEYRWVLAQL